MLTAQIGRKLRVESQSQANLSIESDPKVNWVLNNPQHVPFEIYTTDDESLLRIPGISMISVNQIIAHRGSNG